MSGIQKFVAVAVVLAVFAGAGFWYFRNQEINQQYADAVSKCSGSPTEGAAKIRALDSLYGEGARPDALGTDIDICMMGAATDALKSTLQQLGN